MRYQSWHASHMARPSARRVRTMFFSLANAASSNALEGTRYGPLLRLCRLLNAHFNSTVRNTSITIKTIIVVTPQFSLAR